MSEAERRRPAELARVVLIGFMGAGKTRTGRALASALGWRFVDFDDAVRDETGLAVPEIFATHGEAYFREAEERVGRRLLRERDVVLATGGGWAAAPGRLDAVPPGTETFWLRVSVEEALRRVDRDRGGRPLLDRDDAPEAAARLLAAREPYYRLARFTVDTNGRSVEDVTAGILGILAAEYPGASQTEVE